MRYYHLYVCRLQSHIHNSVCPHSCSCDTRVRVIMISKKSSVQDNNHLWKIELQMIWCLVCSIDLVYFIFPDSICFHVCVCVFTFLHSCSRSMASLYKTRRLRKSRGCSRGRRIPQSSLPYNPPPSKKQVLTISEDAQRASWQSKHLFYSIRLKCTASSNLKWWS